MDRQDAERLVRAIERTQGAWQKAGPDRAQRGRNAYALKCSRAQGLPDSWEREQCGERGGSPVHGNGLTCLRHGVIRCDQRAQDPHEEETRRPRNILGEAPFLI